MNGPRGAGVDASRRPVRAAGLLARWRTLVAVIDQAAISLFNLALIFCLVRVLGPDQFGFVSLWLTVAVLAADIQVPLVALPLNVHVASTTDAAARTRLEEAVTTVNMALVVFAVVAVSLVSLLFAGDWVPRSWLVAGAIPLFIAVGLRREYCRSLAYSRGDMAMLLLTDAPYVLVTSACLVAMLVWPRHFAGIAAAFLAMSLGGMVSQICLRAGGKWRRFALGPRGWAAAYGGIAGEVGWALTGVVSTHLQVRSYIYLTNWLVGLAGVAALNAVGILFRPIATLLTAWARSTLPQLSLAVAEGRFAAFDRAVRHGIVVAAGGGIGWCVALWLVWRPIAAHLFGHKYPEAAMLLLPWAAVSCIVAIEQVPSVALQAARDFRFLAQVGLVAAPVTAAATVGAILWHGYTWTMYGVALGQLVSLALVAGRLCVVRHGLAAPASAGKRRVRRPGFLALPPWGAGDPSNDGTTGI